MITVKSLVGLVSAVSVLLSPLATAQTGDGSLYQRMGGHPTVTKVIEQTIATVARDPRVNRSFDKIDLEKLNAKIVEQVCALAGGDCRYTGDTMKQVHAGLDITEQGFYALVAAMRTALDANGVGEREKNELLRLLAPMKRDVVTR